MKRLSLNSDGALRTTIQSLIPHIRNITSTVKYKKKLHIFITNKKVIL